MDWPRFKLTPAEEKAGASKYYDYETNNRGTLRRFYPGQLILNETIRQPVFTFQIARRCRVMGFTASGDLPQFKIQFTDASGEGYLATPVCVPTLLGGYVELPPAAYGTATAGMTGGYPPNVDDAANTLGWARIIGMPKTEHPFILEPNIILSQNQTLQVTGTPTSEYTGQAYRMDMTFHVYEFPGYDMGPT